METRERGDTDTERSTRSQAGDAPGRGGAATSPSDDFDLLTAALLGVAVGVVTTLVVRRGPSGRSPISTGLTMAGGGVRRATRRKARRGLRRGRDLVQGLDIEGAGDQLRDYLDAARGAIEDTVSGELHDLRKAIRRKRRSLGV